MANPARADGLTGSARYRLHRIPIRPLPLVGPFHGEVRYFPEPAGPSRWWIQAKAPWQQKVQMCVSSRRLLELPRSFSTLECIKRLKVSSVAPHACAPLAPLRINGRLARAPPSVPGLLHHTASIRTSAEGLVVLPGFMAFRPCSIVWTSHSNLHASSQLSTGSCQV